MIAFKPSTEARYWEMLGILPPAAQSGWGFLVGEPMDHRGNAAKFEDCARYAAFFEPQEGVFVESVEPMTVNLFKSLQRDEVFVQ